MGNLKDWKLWAHYIPLTLIVAYYLNLTDTTQIISLYAVIAVADQIVHYAFEKILGWKG